MAATELKIDDDYVTGMGEFLEKEFSELEAGYASYLKIMQAIKDDGLMEGDTATALEKFITYASFLSEKMENLGTTAKNLCDKYLDEIDDKDQYLF
jgi:endonuclease III